MLRNAGFGGKRRTCLVLHRKSDESPISISYEFDFILPGEIGIGTELIILPEIEGLKLKDEENEVKVLLLGDLFAKKCSDIYPRVSRAWLRA